MDLKRYQKWTRGQVFYEDKGKFDYLALGLAGEAGEVAGVIKRAHEPPHGYWNEINLKDEMGDVLWYLTRMCDELGMTLEELATLNKFKLSNRYYFKMNGKSAEFRKGKSKVKYLTIKAL